MSLERFQDLFPKERREVRGATLIASCLALLSVAGCAPFGHRSSSPDPVFLDASALVGNRITVNGYLRYEFENRALYPVDAATRKHVPAACLPVLVGRADNAMDRRVSAFNGKVVTVTGTIDSLAQPGMTVVGTCKDAGIVVEKIELELPG